MTALSLKSRLIAFAALFILTALGLSGAGLVHLFEKSLLWRFESELDANIERVVAMLQVDASGISLARPILDPRYDLPYSGYYWQVADESKIALISKSLWDSTLDTGLDTGSKPVPGGVHSNQVISGPDQQKVLTRTAAVILTAQDGQARPLYVTTAVNYHEFDEYSRQFSFDLWRGFFLLALLLFLASWIQVMVGLRPFRVLSSRLSDVRNGRLDRLEGNYPLEITPLVNETNSLLDTHEKSLTRARERAGRLAHGLKTPLAILSAESRRLSALGRHDTADQINAQIRTMQGVVERELARARSGAESFRRPTDTNIVVLTRRLVGAMRRLSGEEGVSWELQAPPLVRGPISEMDYNEILGNLLDNARKWTRKTVVVRLQPVAGGFDLVVDDDGETLGSDIMESIMKTDGFRVDESAPGNGLGLSIARELIEANRGTIAMDRSPLGGVSVRVHLPSG